MKYMGSKASIAKYILPMMLAQRKEGQSWVEPFVGGGNMIDKVDGVRIGNDRNKYVIALLGAIRDGVNFPYLDKAGYDVIKCNRAVFLDHVVGYAGICCSYSGKWFGGYAGVVNTKGGMRDYQAEARKNIQAQSPNLIGCEFVSASYLDMHIPSNSVIYCDPPYRGTTGYSSSFNHELFYDWCRDRKSDGHTVFISEYEMPNDFKCVWQMEVKSSLSANGKSGASKTSTEKLFTL